MNKVLNKYLIYGFFKVVANTTLIFISLGILLNLFEEIEFFKNLNQSASLPIILSLSYVPNLIIELFPFIIFLSSMWYFLHLKSNTDLLSVKIFGYSNIRIILVLAFTAFVFGNFVLFAFNPVTSTLVKYYEQKKAQYSRDVDHLISINRNGVWIKENISNGFHIINAKNLENNILKNITIYTFDNDNRLIERIESDEAEISLVPWELKNARIYEFKDGLNKLKYEDYYFQTTNSLEKINSLYRNLNTISFLSLITEYEKLHKKGYSKKILNEKINRFISLPIFLALMVVVASIFTIGSIKQRQNLYFILISILTCVVIYYFKDLSLALGQTERISLTLSVWMPIIAVSLFCSIGVIQINEK